MGGEEVPQQWTTEVPEQQARGAPERQAEEVPEQQARGALERRAEERPMAETVGPPPQDVGVDPKATAGGSSRHRAVQEIVPADQTVSILVLELLYHRSLAFWQLMS